jgi:hypothetical protein
MALGSSKKLLNVERRCYVEVRGNLRQDAAHHVLVVLKASAGALCIEIILGTSEPDALVAMVGYPVAVELLVPKHFGQGAAEGILRALNLRVDAQPWQGTFGAGWIGLFT